MPLTLTPRPADPAPIQPTVAPELGRSAGVIAPIGRANLLFSGDVARPSHIRKGDGQRAERSSFRRDLKINPLVMLTRPFASAGWLARSRTSPATFARFYEEMSPSILRFFVRQTHDSQRAFDLTAETFAKAFEKRADFRGATDEQAAAWLWTIARNELARSHRSSAVELAAVERLGLERPAPSDTELRELEYLIAFEDVREQLERALALLPADQQEVIRLRFGDELGYVEIADRLGVSHEVVRARTSRALRTLRTSDELRASIDWLES